MSTPTFHKTVVTGSAHRLRAIVLEASGVRQPAVGWKASDGILQGEWFSVLGLFESALELFGGVFGGVFGYFFAESGA